MRIATITPTRGDRKQFFEFAKVQMDTQTVQPDCRYYMDYIPESREHDLTKRIKRGVELAKKDNIDAVFIWEDDDAMCSHHIESLLPHLQNNDFVGYDSTVYYNVRNKTWMSQTHPKRSSLFCTAFKVSALDDFIWPADHYLWLDVKLWEHARDKRKPVKFLGSNPCTGIKHNVGVCAGKSHHRLLEHNDMDMSFLNSRVEPYQIEFYKKLKL